DRTLAGELDLLLVVGLGVRGDRAGLLRVGRGLRAGHREVDGRRGVAGGLEPAELQLGRALGVVVVAELREVLLVDRHQPAGGLGDAGGEVPADGQLVAALLVGLDHVDAVGHAAPRNAGFPTVDPRVLVGVVEHPAGEDLGILGLAVDHLDLPGVEAVVARGTAGRQVAEGALDGTAEILDRTARQAPLLGGGGDDGQRDRRGGGHADRRDPATCAAENGRSFRHRFSSWNTEWYLRCRRLRRQGYGKVTGRDTQA